MNMLEQGEQMLDAAFEYAAISIEYVRAGSVVATIPAKIGRTLFRTENAFGVTVRTECRDFIVRAADLDLTPEVGDEIICGDKKYLVSAPNDEPCWKWHTKATHSQKRIHTQMNGEK